MSRRSWFGRKSSKKPLAKKNFGPVRLQMEQLERRELKAADGVEAFIQQGTLYVRGTQQDDNIAVHVSQTKVEIPGVMIKNERGQLVSSVGRNEVPYQVIATGQAGDDRIELVEEGSTLPVIFYGNQGDDTLVGGSTDDALIGQDGVDRLIGKGGDDKIIAGLYADGTDLVQNNNAAEILDGGPGNDVLYGTQGEDFLFGGAGDDKLMAFAGDDRLSGGAGRNTYDAGDGVDTIEEISLYGATLTNDSITVTHRLATGVLVTTTATLLGVEKALLMADYDARGLVFDAMGFGGDTGLIGSPGADVLKGGSGNDEIYGHEGDDLINAGRGMANVVDGGEGRDRLSGSVGGGVAILSDAAFEEIGESSTRLSNIEEASLVNWTATSRYDLLVEASRGWSPDRNAAVIAGINRAFRTPGRPGFTGLAGTRMDTSGWVTQTGYTLVDATKFTGGVSVSDPDGMNMTHEMVALGQLRLRDNPNILYDFTPTESALLGQLEKAVRQAKGVSGYGDLGPQVASGVIHGVAYIRFANVAFYRWGSEKNQGAIIAGETLKKYVSMGAEHSDLGMPTSMPQGVLTPDGGYSIVYQTFENGVLASTTKSDEWHAVMGNAYYQLMANGGFSVLGAPKGDTSPIDGGVANAFERGIVFAFDSNPRGFQPAVLNFDVLATRYTVDGAYSENTAVNLFEYWKNMGGATSPLHLPVAKAERFTLPSGEVGFMQRFQDGALFWTPSHGISSVQGLIYKMYMHEGGPLGRFGLPEGDEYFAQGRFVSRFEHGYIQFLPDSRRFYVSAGPNYGGFVDEDDI